MTVGACICISEQQQGAPWQPLQYSMDKKGPFEPVYSFFKSLKKQVGFLLKYKKLHISFHAPHLTLSQLSFNT